MVVADTNGDLSTQAIPSVSDASTTVKGVTKLSVAPVSPTDPIAVGDNDPRNSDARTPTAHASSHTNGTDDIQTASALQKGLLSSTDWSTFNNKQPAATGTPDGTKFLRDDNSWQNIPAQADASTTVKGITKLSVAPVSPTNPIAVGDNDPRNSDARTPTAHASSHTNGTDDIQTASALQKGLLSSTDWSTFNGKQDALVSGTNIKTINGNSLLGAGNLVLSGTGDVVGPGSSVDDNIATFDGLTGKLIQDGGKKISDLVDITSGQTVGGAKIFTDNVTVDAASGGVAKGYILDTDDPTSGTHIQYKTSGVDRWHMDVSGTESGGNAGSLFRIRRYDDAGVLLSTPFQISRVTGAVSLVDVGIQGNITMSGATDVAITTADKVIYKDVTDGGNLRAATVQEILNLVPNPEGWTVIVKPSNQDVTNAGVTNDSNFTFSVVANGHYMVKMELVASGNNTTADYTCDFQVSAGTMRGKGTLQGITAAAAVSNVIVTAAAAANTTAIPIGAATANIDDLVYVNIQYAFTATSNGTFRFRFGNATPTIGATSRTWKGSIMRYKNID
jgi:hypothetical protein